MNMILGVREINIYYVNMNETVLKPFRYYERKGQMTVSYIPAVPKYEKTFAGNQLSSSLALNDCMYKNMYRYKWIVGVDYDEVILPNIVQNYSTLLRNIDISGRKYDSSLKSYSFRNAYFWVSCGGELKEPKHSYMMRYVRRDPVSRSMSGPKTILSPLTCVSLFPHYCLHRIGKPRRHFTIQVPLKLATSHHYRVTYNKQNCENLKENGKEDWALLQWKTQLKDRFETIINELKL